MTYPPTTPKLRASSATDLSSMADSLAMRSVSALDSLLPLLSDPTRLTNFEFLTYILPSLHTAACTDAKNATKLTPTNESPTRRTAKRQRKDTPPTDRQTFLEKIFEKCVAVADVPGPDSPDSMVVDAPDAAMSDSDGKLKVGDKVCLDPDFVEHRGVPPGPMGVEDSGVVVDLNPGRVFVEVRGQLWHYLRASLKLGERAETGSSSALLAAKNVPPLIRYLHRVLSFSERVTVVANNSPEFSDLESLIVPFNVRLRRATAQQQDKGR